MIISSIFMFLFDGGRFDSDEETKCKDYFIISLLILGLCLTIPLDIITLPIQLCICGLNKCFYNIKQIISNKNITMNNNNSNLTGVGVGVKV